MTQQTMVKKKVPMRLCIGCQEMKSKKELVRIVKSEDGILIDSTGKKNGRGAYICPNPDCLAKAKKTKALERTLDAGSIAPSVYEALGKELS